MHDIEMYYIHATHTYTEEECRGYMSRIYANGTGLVVPAIEKLSALVQCTLDTHTAYNNTNTHTDTPQSRTPTHAIGKESKTYHKLCSYRQFIQVHTRGKA